VSSLDVTVVDAAPPTIQQPGVQTTRTLGLVSSAANGNGISVQSFDTLQLRWS